MDSKIIKLLIISKLSMDSGNFNTMVRISQNIQSLSSSIRIKFFKVSNPSQKEKELEYQLNQWKPDLILGLNLLKCLFISNININAAVIMILGGTDINIEINEEVRLKLLDLIRKCRRIIAFSDEMKARFQTIFSEVNINTSTRVDVIPQGIDVIDVENYKNNAENNLMLDNLNIEFLFLVVGRLRPVKDPGFIVQPFTDWASVPEHSKFHLLFVGDIEEKTEEILSFLEDIKQKSNIHYIGSLPKERVFNLMLKSKALINCSKNEGQSTAILEAMFLGVPILARNVTGNKDIIINNFNGLLFSDEKELKSNLTVMLDDRFSKSFIENAKNYVMKNHNSRTEAYKYMDIITEII